jgi:hypothetical protein
VPSGSITTALGGANADQFTKSNDNCNGQTLGAGQSCTLDGAFAPSSSGLKNGSISASATPGGNATTNLTGTGQTAANLTISPTSWNFGNVWDQSSATRAFVLTNNGEQAATGIGFGILGDNRFGLNLGASNCGPTLAGGASCNIAVDFDPEIGDAPTGFSATLNVGSTVGGSPSAPLSGTAAATAANLQISITSESATTPGTYASSDSRNLGTGIQAGNFTQSKVWIKNTGAADASVPTSPIPFSTTGGSFQALAPLSTCNIADEPQIRFTNPVIVGGAECYVVVTGGPNVNNQPFSASFTITGTPGGSITGTISGN